jgi:hypothetical protein
MLRNSYGGLLRSLFACDFTLGGNIELVDIWTRK